MDTTTPADTATAQALQQMADLLRQSQDLNRQFMSHLASKPTETVKEPPMPKWDGNITSKDLYLEQMDVYLSHKYFSSVTSWDKADANTGDIATYLRS
jgi:hypothetical protein